MHVSAYGFNANYCKVRSWGVRAADARAVQGVEHAQRLLGRVHHAAVMPPSTTSWLPVVKRERSEAR